MPAFVAPSGKHHDGSLVVDAREARALAVLTCTSAGWPVSEINLNIR
jgi:hypothetical protein